MRTVLPKRGPLVVLFAALALARPAAAQDIAAAEALFNKGLADMEAGRYAEGCSALAESERLEPLPGTLFTLAECQSKAGKVATAVVLYDEYLQVFARLTAEQQRKQRGRDKISKTKRDDMKPHVPTLVLELPATAPDGTVVTRDDVVLNAPALGIPLPVDPGEHAITTRPPGGQVHHQTVTIALDEKKTVALEVLAPSDASPTPPLVSPQVTVAPAAPPPPPPESSSLKPLAYVLGGIGVVGLGVGAVLGGVTLSKGSDVKAGCVDHVCNATGYDAAQSAKTTGAVSTVAFGVGAAGLAAAAILWVVAPKAPKTGKLVIHPNFAASPGGASIGLGGAL